MARIGIRILIAQHVALHSSTLEESSRFSFVGLIDPQCSLARVCRDAVSDASVICQRVYGDAPEVVIHDGQGVRIRHIPAHLYYIFFELLKNSMRAVMERSGDSLDVPEVHVIIVQSSDEVTIKISDQGGGIPRSMLPKLFSYTYTTAETPLGGDEALRASTGSSVSSGSGGEPLIGLVRAPLAGFGYGLPLSRAYARYFGGDLQLVSMEGFGTDAYVFLSSVHKGEEELS
eukprot:GABV01000473.1.p1 GENE.GABV01000473.1~~GABV01000473.1.p1  ORF type:complete len:231 (+),score=60.49 GABV01000473.1:614-1306(+)